jgi:cysteine dioxygenase
MAHPLRTSVEDFVEGLKALERDLITKELVTQYMDAMRLTTEALKPYTFFSPDTYTRNLIYRDPLFELMLICWQPGQQTAIHTHNGQLGWMAVPQGEVVIHNYHYVNCNAPENQNVVGMDCLGGATRINLETLQILHCSGGGPIATVDKIQTIHQIENTEKSASGSMSLHIYSLPFDSCIAFNLEEQRCFRKTLRWYSRYGKLEPEREQNATDLVQLAE